MAPAITDLAWELERKWFISPKLVSALVGRINGAVEASHQCSPRDLFEHLRIFLYMVRAIHEDVWTSAGVFSPKLPQAEQEKVSNLLDEIEDKLLSTVIGNLSSVCACQWQMGWAKA